MYICYMDEAGCTGYLPQANTNIQPVFVLSGLIVDSDNISTLTREFINLKTRFMPKVANDLKHPLDIAKIEIKGAEDLRTPIRKGGRNKERRTTWFLDKVISLLKSNECQIISYIYIKKPKNPFDGNALYTKYVQDIHRGFQRFLEDKDSKGIIIADSRTPTLNARVSHSVFTQKHKVVGDEYSNCIEAPTFGHSENHILLQITDIICSALIFPIASYSYCTGYIQNPYHVNSRYEILKDRYADSFLREESFRFHDGERYRGGITVHDQIGHRSSRTFFSKIKPDHLKRSLNP